MNSRTHALKRACACALQVANFCFTNLLLQQQQHQLGVIVSAMTAVQPAMTVNKLLPMCLRILLVSPSDTCSARTPRTPSSARVNRTASSSSAASPKFSPQVKPRLNESSGAEQSPDKECGTPTAPDGSAMSGGYKLALLSEMEIVYYLNLIRYVADNAGDAVLPHRDQLMAAIDLALKVEERPGVVSLQVFKAANKLVRALIHSLVTCRPAEHRSVPPAVWNDPEWQKKHYESWGHVIDMASVDITWVTPSEAGLQWAADLAARYIRKPLAMLRKYISAISTQEESAAQPAAGVNHQQKAGDDSMQIDGEEGGCAATDTASISAPSASSGAHVNGESDMACDGDGEASASSGKKQMDLEIHVPNRTCDLPASAARSNLRRKIGTVSATEARLAVLQVRYVLEGLVAAMPGWDDAGGEGEDDDMSEGDDQGIESKAGFPGGEVYTSCTYELPRPNIDVSQLHLGDGEEASDLRPARIAGMVRELVRIALKQHSQDSKMLKALAKCVDVCMNGVDILQKHTRRLRLRYSIMKARNREVAPDGYTKLLPRYMVVVKLHHHYLSRVMIRQRKMNSLPIIASMLDGVSALSVNEHSGVRARGQLALLSFCRRYRGSCGSALPKLITILEDKDIDEPGHEQRICGACVLLQTRYFQGRILRDWRMIEYFLIALCSSYHNDKDTVLDALDGLFATFLSYWYQISLETPGYMAWRGGKDKWERAQVPFQDYGRMLEVLVKLLKTAPHMHWRFKLMVIDAVTVMIRDDVQSHMAVWECILDGMVSENSHIREACVPALGSALELMQNSQQSKEDVDGLQARFPDKTFHHWNGPPRPAYLSTSVFDARKRTSDAEYKASVRKVVMGYFTDEQYLEKLTNVMSVVQLGRSKHMNGSHAQLFKGLLKAFGPAVVAPFEVCLCDLLSPSPRSCS